MKRYMTKEQLQALGFEDPAQAARAVADAEAVHAFVARTPGASEADLSQQAVAQWGADEADARLRGALAVLALKKRIVSFEAACRARLPVPVL